jgi:predicted  nucleic acid-binding Zn-ribbon protein
MRETRAQERPLSCARFIFIMRGIAGAAAGRPGAGPDHVAKFALSGEERGMTDDRGDDKRGPVRPTVIEGQAEEIRPEEAQDAKASKEAAADAEEERKADDAATAEAGSGRAEEDTEKAVAAGDENGEDAGRSAEAGAQMPDDDAGDDRTAAGASSSGEEEEGRGDDAQAAAAAPAKSRTGLKLLGGLLLLGAAAGGGIWVYDQYGPGRELAALKARIARLEQVEGRLDDLVAARIGAALKARDERIAKVSDSIAGLEKWLRAMEERLAALSGSMPGAEGIEALEKEIAALKARLARADEAGAAHAARLKALEKALAEVRAELQAMGSALEKATAAVAGPEAGASGEAREPAGASTERAKAALQAAALARKLAALEMKVAALEEGGESAGTQAEAVSALKAQLAGLRGDVAALEKEIAEGKTRALEALKTARAALEKAEAAVSAVEAMKAAAEARPRVTPPAIGKAFAALREKVHNGEPFAAELKTMEGFLPDSAALAELRPHAGTGVKSREALISALERLAAAHAEARRRQLEKMAAEGIAGGLKARLMQVVKIRRKGEVDWAEVLREATAAGRRGGLAAALNVLEKAQGARPEDVAAWEQQARARLAADAALAALAGDVVQAMLRGAAGGKRNAGTGAKGPEEQTRQ